MSAKRVYTIKCDGPSCMTEIVTPIAFVADARDIAKKAGWWKIGDSTRERSMDFCSQQCEYDYENRVVPFIRR